MTCFFLFVVVKIDRKYLRLLLWQYFCSLYWQKLIQPSIPWKFYFNVSPPFAPIMHPSPEVMENQTIVYRLSLRPLWLSVKLWFCSYIDMGWCGRKSFCIDYISLDTIELNFISFISYCFWVCYLPKRVQFQKYCG